jgi:hypothetical protein
MVLLWSETILHCSGGTVAGVGDHSDTNTQQHKQAEGTGWGGGGWYMNGGYISSEVCTVQCATII